MAELFFFPRGKGDIRPTTSHAFPGAEAQNESNSGPNVVPFRRILEHHDFT
jgi:hypothetical protein